MPTLQETVQPAQEELFHHLPEAPVPSDVPAGHRHGSTVQQSTAQSVTSSSQLYKLLSTQFTALQAHLNAKFHLLE